MRRFLMVGCGGSGGATLQFVMDQLRADLSRLGFDHLPAGWQFVHVDVPLAGDGVGEGMPPTVAEQGGRYVPLAYAGATYPAVWNGLENAISRTSGARAGLAPWAPDPSTVNVPITVGAGQMRAVGRVLALPQAPNIAGELSQAWGRLMPAAAIDELQRVAAVVSRETAGEAATPPLVLVVSSMAGGAGASMVLDVCRILAGIPAIDPNLIGLFLYTPQVFESLPEAGRQGVDANAMAMMGELIAAQVGASAPADNALLDALGLVQPAEHRLPFKRVFPIGSHIGGTGELFGDGSVASVYRAVGRGLAALMLSGRATHEFTSYDLGNPDTIGPDVESLGWGVPEASADLVQWGSFGFASVGLGRDRYAEYSAQRLARVAVDRLVEGHIRPGNAATGSEQLAEAVDARWQWFAQQRLGLPGTVPAAQIWDGWFPSVVPEQTLRASVVGLFDNVLGSSFAPQGQVAASDWLGAWRSYASTRQQQLVAGIEDTSYQWAYAWQTDLTSRVEAAVAEVASQQGMPLALALLDRLGEEIPGWVAALRSRSAPPDPSRSLPEAEDAVGGLGKGVIGGAHAALETLKRGHLTVLKRSVLVRSATLAADILTSMRGEMLEPLKAELRDNLRTLALARSERVRDRGLARLDTDEYAAWPSGVGVVDRRFESAHNELFLTRSSEFESLFSVHVMEATKTRQIGDALADAVTSVLSGSWPDAGGVVQSVDVVQRTSTWRPSVLPYTPGDSSGQIRPATRAGYRFAFRADEVLSRSRRWLSREQEPFQRFVGMTLNQYLTESGVPEYDLAERTSDLRDKFVQAMKYARPLVGVQTQTYITLHSQSGVQTLREGYKFSELPFRGGQIETALRSDLLGMNELDPTVVQHFDRALCGENQSSRIDIFGSYSPCSPLVFSSLLDPIAQQWRKSVVGGSTLAFWRNRRSRRLPGALPLTDAARRATIAGYFVGRLTGRIRVPGESHNRSVEVYDSSAGGMWRPYPETLLTNPDGRAESRELLPALLESMVIAMAQCSADPSLAPLLPYRLTRELFDDTRKVEHQGQRSALAATRHLGAWIRDGRTESGVLPNPAYAGRPEDSAEDRRKSILDYLGELRDYVGVQYLAPGQLGAEGGGAFSTLEHVPTWNVPLFHEIGQDLYLMLGELRTIVSEVQLVPVVPNGPGI